MTRFFALLAIALALFAFGCAGSQPAAPAPAAPSTTCGEYCPTLQHANCSGEWAVSGVFPGCNCTYNCPSTPAPPPPNATVPGPAQNVTPPANQTQPANVSPAQPSAPTTGKSISQLLADGLDSARMKFYGTNSGTFRESRYTWLQSPENASPGEIQMNSANDVKFDNASIGSIDASGFVAFTNADTGARAAYGLAIFSASATPLDGMAGAFPVDYFPPVIDKDLRLCIIYDTVRQTARDGGPLVTYYFRCGDFVEK